MPAKPFSHAVNGVIHAALGVMVLMTDLPIAPWGAHMLYNIQIDKLLLET